MKEISLQQLSLQKIDAAVLAKLQASGDPVPEDFLTWEERRGNMQNVGKQCHTKAYIENFYVQYDNQVNMYNEKYGILTTEIMNAMMGRDYTQWHGNFEVAERMYTEFIPEVKEMILEAKSHGNAAAANEVEALLTALLESDMHQWYIGKMNPEDVERRKEEAE